jgi:hypothetical protein
LPIASIALVEKVSSLTGCNYASNWHVRARGCNTLRYLVAVTELPSDGQGQRITKAVDAAYPGTKEAGTRGQATRVHRRMEELFPGRAPHFTTVLRWIEEPGRITIDAIYLIARAVGADPATLAFGPTLTASAPQSDSETEGLDIDRAQQQRGAPRPANPGDEQSGGSGRLGG